MAKRAERTIRLAWDGKKNHPEAPASGPSLTPETRIARADFGELHAGDNALVLESLRGRYAEAFTLAYLDPPFLTNRVHELKVRAKGGEPERREAAFDDRWPDRAAYLEALGRRLELVRPLLAPEGSVVVHVDPKTSHYVKVMCDEIFGDDAFTSEIIWRYRRWPSKTQNFQNVHDVLLRYRKDPKVPPRWNSLYEPLAPSTLATWGTKKQRAVVGASGKRVRSSSEEVESKGVPLGDVWDIGVVAPIARERTGYPTQKPEALLERLLRALTSPGDRVLDPYAGSGTTLAVAKREQRWFLGIDASEVALQTASTRLGLSSFAPSVEERFLERPALRTMA